MKDILHMILQAPAEVMAATLSHLEDAYGGASAYLQSLGFTKGQQQRLAKALATPISSQ
jgi:hypothetical protein